MDQQILIVMNRGTMKTAIEFRKISESFNGHIF